MSSSYDVANESTYFKTWYNGLFELTPDKELIEDQTLIRLRKTSRKLIKNNFIAAGAQQAYVNTILGGKIKIGVLTDNEKLKEEVERVFGIALNGVDINRQYSLSQITEMIINSAFADGDILINLPIDKRKKTGLQTYVELVEASRIKTPPKHKTNPLVRAGVEYYSSGRLKGYWIIKIKKQAKYVTYVTANDNDFEFFPAYKKDENIARRVCWLFKAPLNLRPDQSRQIPVMTSIMGLLRYFNQYLEAVLIGSRVAACFSAFVKSNNPVQARKSLEEDDEDPNISAKGKKLTKLQPGLISYLRTNEDITFATPNRPSDNFDNFVLRLARFIAMTLRLPYEQMFLDLSETNYSSWRGGSLEVERNINRWRRDLDAVLRWIIFTFLREALVKNMIKSPLKGLTLQITFPKYKSLDEEKSARARRMDLNDSVTSLQHVSDELGTDRTQLDAELDNETDVAVDREARKLIRQKEWSAREDIIFEGQEPEEERDTSESRREGESEEEDLSEEEKRERRKEDANW